MENLDLTVCSRCGRSIPLLQGQPAGLTAEMPDSEAYLRPGEVIICVICVRGAQAETGLAPDPGFLVQRL